MDCQKAAGAKYFYPRTPVECDRQGLPDYLITMNFYPRTPVECDK